ncbi:unnamed protein product [Ectocarpus sp. 12 AP-2014]
MLSGRVPRTWENGRAFFLVTTIVVMRGMPVSMMLGLFDMVVYEGVDTACHLTRLRGCLGGIATAQVQSKFKKAGLRVKVDRGSERLAKQIRTAEKERIPVMSVVGEKEVAAGTLAVRSRGFGDMGDVPVDELIASMLEADAAAKELHEFLEPKAQEAAEAVDV